MSAGVRHGSIRELAAGVWSYRLGSELESAARFRALAPRLRACGASSVVADMAEEAASDELRHAGLCRELIRHFGGELPHEREVSLAALAPRGVEHGERVLYEIVALSCVTETLSTAVLGELVARAQDPVCRQAMHSILRDEVSHSRLGWAFLAEARARGLRDCVGPHLPAMLHDTLGHGFFEATEAQPPELSGLGALSLSERQRVAWETLEHVVFPGLERFGIDTALGRRWLGARSSAARELRQRRASKSSCTST